MHRQMSRRERRAGQRGRGKATENLAFLYGVCLSTALAQALQLHLQPPQRIDALADMIDVRVQNVVHASAVLLRSVAEPRSEEHTSELQSLMRISYAVFCLTKKKTQNQTNNRM